MSAPRVGADPGVGYHVINCTRALDRGRIVTDIDYSSTNCVAPNNALSMQINIINTNCPMFNIGQLNLIWLFAMRLHYFGTAQPCSGV